jgi:hypothetical protein
MGRDVTVVPQAVEWSGLFSTVKKLFEGKKYPGV